MKSNWILALAAVAGLACAALASCDTASAAPLYISGHVGAATQVGASDVSFDDGQTYGVAIGTAVGPLRVEAGVDRHNASGWGGSLNGRATVYNASAFLDTQSGFYAGGGVDWAQASVSFYGCKENDQGFGYHAAVGFAHRVADNVIVDAQARYTHLDVFGGASDVTYTIGARVAV